ncbi:hypothetical protein [Lactobacillus delbrueckii]|uniref:hypothetical protein n=1 Tax=Lactobacillus delbrueckii TaxID=1584 RepID=UPI001E416E8A|nr:hypothetical protein [Lactobacillus delbrueckii]MCD5445556.1 hypothetical protein [Lactobacillus delbrueckii subsp. lactis]
MHHIMGYSWDEIMAMVTIFATVGGGLIWLLHLAIKSGTERLSNKLSQLINQVDSLNHMMSLIESTANRTTRRVDTLEDRFEEHEGNAKVRNQRITALEKEVFRYENSK